jgi:hypothetical protein
MKSQLVAIAAGSSYTAVSASVAAHYITLQEDGGSPANVLVVQRADDGFTGTYTYPAGSLITLYGCGRSGMVARPAGFNAPGVPATAEPYFYVKTQSGAATNVRLTEYQSDIN